MADPPPLSQRIAPRSLPFSPSLQSPSPATGGRHVSNDKTWRDDCFLKRPTPMRLRLPAPASTKHGIQGPLIDGQHVTADLLYASSNPVAVQWS